MLVGAAAMLELERLRNIYVASTLPDQKRFNSFTRGLRQNVGRAATILGTDKVHLTYLESNGMRSTLEKYGYTREQEDDFASGMQAYLNKHGYGRQLKARVNSGQPLRWITKRPGAHVLAMNFAGDNELADRRATIDEFLLSQFGIHPPVKDFTPHVTLGTVSKVFVTREIYEDPSLMVPSYAITPRTVALDGVLLYYGQIHRSSERSVPPANLEASEAVFAASPA